MTTIPKDGVIPVEDEPRRRVIRGRRDLSIPIREDEDFQPDLNIIVSAGAGSGKTSVLIERMIALVRMGTKSQEIVAITFTKKAAGELQERYFSGLLNAKREVSRQIEQSTGSENEEWKTELSNIESALMTAEEVFIGTIHSFCARLLRQRAFLAGIPPDFRQIDEVEEEKLRKSFWYECLDSGSRSEDPDLAVLRDAHVSISGLFNLFGTLVRNASINFSLSGAEEPDLSPVFDTLSDYLTVLAGQLPISDEPDDFLVALNRCILTRNAATQPDKFEMAHVLGLALEAVKMSEKPQLRITYSRWGERSSEPYVLATKLKKGEDDFGLGKPFAEYLIEDVNAALKSWQHWLHDIALRFASKSVGSYRTHRLDTGNLTYDDLLQEATRLVYNSASSRARFQEKYTRILVDEFQDTDPEQAAMLFGLASLHPCADSWMKSKLLPGTLFLVGDENQSIYRFRKADFQAFDLIRDAISSSGGLHLQLTANFRSDSRICHWINKSVGDLISNGREPFQASWNDLMPTRGNLGETDPVVRFEIGKSCRNRSLPKVRAEAAAIVEWIRSKARPDADGQTDWGQFMIILRRHTNMPHYIAALATAGISVGVSGGRGENASDVLPLIDDFLRTVYDPNDGVALISILRGPLFGISDSELLKYRESGGAWEHHLAGIESIPGNHESLADARNALVRAVELFRDHPPYRAMELFLGEFGIEAGLSVRLDGDVAVGMLEKILSLIHDWESKGMSFGECVTEIGRYRRGELTLDLYSDSMPWGSCVQILTAHQAKGLQADYVFLADSGGAAPPPPSLHVWRDASQISGTCTVMTGKGYRERIELEPEGWEDASERETSFDEAERLRLIYVACTRAKKQLIISTNQSEGSGPWDALISGLEGSKVPVFVLDPIPDPPSWNPALRPAVPPREDAGLSASDVAARIEDLSRETWTIRRPSQGDLQEVLPVAIKPAESDERLAPRGSSGLEYGSALHSLFETLVGRRKNDIDAPTLSDLNERVMSSRFSGEKLDRYLESGEHAAKQFLESTLWNRLVSASRVLTEVPFTVTHVESGLDVVTSGVVDLAFRTKEGWTIVDYKSDTVEEDTLLDRHAFQIQAYVRAWSSIFPDESCSGLIWSTQSGREVRVKALK